MKIYVYVTSVGVIDKTPVVVHSVIGGGGWPKEWVFAYSYDHKTEMSDDKLNHLFEEHQKTIFTPEKEIAELKAKLAKYEEDQS